MTQGERQDYKWRPNDNGVSTRTRYDLEAEHWYRSFKAAERKHKPVNYGSVFSTIGLFVQLVFTLLTLIVVLVIDIIKWLRS